MSLASVRAIKRRQRARASWSWAYGYLRPYQINALNALLHQGQQIDFDNLKADIRKRVMTRLTEQAELVGRQFDPAAGEFISLGQPRPTRSLEGVRIMQIEGANELTNKMLAIAATGQAVLRMSLKELASRGVVIDESTGFKKVKP